MRSEMWNPNGKGSLWFQDSMKLFQQRYVLEMFEDVLRPNMIKFFICKR